MNSSKWIIRKIDCILESDSQYGGLYLGNYGGALEIDELMKCNIKAVLTCAWGLPLSYPKEIIDEHCVIEADDLETYNLKEHFQRAIDFIHTNRKKASVFVHCLAGVSRSAALVIVYLMAKLNMRYPDALKFVQDKRMIICPNSGFIKQMIEYDKELFEKRKIDHNQNETEASRIV